MKPFYVILIAVLLLAGRQAGFGQNFMNLDFEQAQIVPLSSGYTPTDADDPISAASALPYWTVTEDGILCNAVWGEPDALDETSVALVSTGSSPSPIQGNYSVQLSSYADAPANLYTSSAISQMGLIPAGTESIQFLIVNPSPPFNYPYPYPGVTCNPVVTLNGTQISLQETADSGGVMTMVGDVSAFAGTAATLTFSCSAIEGAAFPADENYFNLDDIQFSASPVPEPSELAFAALGGLSFVWRRWRNMA